MSLLITISRYLLLLIIISLLINLSNIYIRYQEKISLSDDKRIQIIYFSHLRKEKWKYIIIPQMNDLVNCGILSQANLLVALSGDRELVKVAERKIRDIIEPHLTFIQFTYTYENLYEYPGIKALYDSSLIEPEKIFIYFHSKGMWFGGDDKSRTRKEKTLMDNVITRNWVDILNVFDTNPDISKVCFGSSNGGWCWFNFYWVRGSYISKCNKPEIRPNRYYYEGYLGHQYRGPYPFNQTFDNYDYNLSMGYQNTTYMGTYNIAMNNSIPFFDPALISDILDQMT